MYKTDPLTDGPQAEHQQVAIRHSIIQDMNGPKSKKDSSLLQPMLQNYSLIDEFRSNVMLLIQNLHVEGIPLKKLLPEYKKYFKVDISFQQLCSETNIPCHPNEVQKKELTIWCGIFNKPPLNRYFIICDRPNRSEDKDEDVTASEKDNTSKTEIDGKILKCKKGRSTREMKLLARAANYRNIIYLESDKTSGFDSFKTNVISSQIPNLKRNNCNNAEYSSDHEKSKKAKIELMETVETPLSSERLKENLAKKSNNHECNNARLINSSVDDDEILIKPDDIDIKYEVTVGVDDSESTDSIAECLNFTNEVDASILPAADETEASQMTQTCQSEPHKEPLLERLRTPAPWRFELDPDPTEPTPNLSLIESTSVASESGQNGMYKISSVSKSSKPIASVPVIKSTIVASQSELDEIASPSTFVSKPCSPVMKYPPIISSEMHKKSVTSTEPVQSSSGIKSSHVKSQSRVNKISPPGKLASRILVNHLGQVRVVEFMAVEETCAYCKATFPDDAELSKHVRSKSCRETMCRLCGQTFYSKNLLQEHFLKCAASSTTEQEKPSSKGKKSPSVSVADKAI